jgi:hypothetical protein
MLPVKLKDQTELLCAQHGTPLMVRHNRHSYIPFTIFTIHRTSHPLFLYTNHRKKPPICPAAMPPG